MGRQGSGKGTQAARLSSLLDVPHVSTGDAFRAAAKQGTDLGREVQGYMDRGELVPDRIVVEVVSRYLFGPGRPPGFVLDGFPRTISQAEALEPLAAPGGLDLVVDLDAPVEEVVRRIAGRRSCPACGAAYNVATSPPLVAERCDACGTALSRRDDDTEEAVRRRLELYETETAPVLEWYARRGLLARVDALGTPDEVAERIAGAVRQAART